MKKAIMALLLAALLLSAAPAETYYRSITQEEAAAFMKAETGYIILDVRTEEEYDEGHIPGAINIPNEDIGTDAPPELPDRDQALLVYCRSGRRSKEAAEKLAAMGYSRVLEFGGIMTWTGEIVSTEAEALCDDDPYDARSYDDPEDFYEDYRDDFDDYEDAEAYYYEYADM